MIFCFIPQALAVWDHTLFPLGDIGVDIDDRYLNYLQNRYEVVYGGWNQLNCPCGQTYKVRTPRQPDDVLLNLVPTIDEYYPAHLKRMLKYQQSGTLYRMFH